MNWRPQALQHIDEHWVARRLSVGDRPPVSNENSQAELVATELTKIAGQPTKFEAQKHQQWCGEN